MDNGWVKLHRKIFESFLYPKNREFSKYEAWIDLLLLVNHSDQKVLIKNEVFECLRGQSIMSIESYQKRWNWTPQQVRSYFSLLEKNTMIERKGTSKTTILTICNYDNYQSIQQTDNKQITNEQQTDNKQITTNKNEKKEKNEKNEKKFVIPTQIEIENYFLQLSLNGLSKKESEKFFDFYTSKNWFVGKNKMKDWKAACRNWKLRINEYSNKPLTLDYKPDLDIQNNPDRLKFKRD